jgi:hypothetical protein
VDSPHPFPELTSFDVVICGTGLRKFVLVAAHVDLNLFYGSFYASISLPSFLSVTPPFSFSRVSHPKILISECEPFFPQET